MNLWKISRHCEFARHIALGGSAFIDSNTLTKDPHYRWFIVAGCYQINRELYTYFRENRYNVNCSMDTELLSYGQSSMTFLVRMFKNSDGVTLVNNTCAGVWVDRQTRKSKPLPDWFRNKYRKEANVKVDWLKPQLAPLHAFSYQTEVQYSDIDKNLHANQSFYIRACMDCGATASYSGYYRKFRGDFFKYHADKLWVVYVRECEVGDMLEVLTWDSPDEVECVYFQIRLKKDPVFHAKLKAHLDIISYTKL